ncbi:MAG: hypothetical protein RLZZ08_151 [Pseudomonadota bacterium]|jgi:hypothetical protein
MRRCALSLLAPLMLVACGGDGADRPTAGENATAVAVTPAAIATPTASATIARPPQVEQFPKLASKDCATVAQFYADALRRGAYDQAALVWADPAIDGARLQALFGGYSRPDMALAAPEVEGAAGSSYCTVTGSLKDAAEPARAAVDGEMLLRRVNDVDGATPVQLRWTLRSSTFVDKLERSAGS